MTKNRSLSIFFYKKALIAALFFFLINNLYLTAQSNLLINKQFQFLSGNPASDIDWAASTKDVDGNIITTGNTVDANFNVNLLLIKQSPKGQVIWEKEFSAGIGTKNYGIAVTSDINGNIYVAGASFNNANQNHDYLILKYDALGNLQWSHIENGLDNGEDIPAAIALDINNNIYVTGGSFANTTNYDFLTLRLNNNGQLNWSQRFDHNNLPDVAVDLRIDVNGDVEVIGGSSTTVTDWNYTSLRYDGISGSLITNVQFFASTGITVPTAVEVLSNGNLVVTGYGGVQNDCLTILLDDDFNVLWQTSYDGAGLDDRAFDVAVDAQDNIYVCGYTEKQNGGKDFLLIKYDSNGNNIWTEKRTARDQTKAAKALFTKIDEINNHVIVAGEEEGDNGNRYIKTIRYDLDGLRLWEDIHDGSSSTPETPTSLLIGNDQSFMVTGVINEFKYETILYETTPHQATSVTIGGADIIDNEIIIRFNPSVIDTAFANNPFLLYGEVHEIITDNNLIMLMDSALNANGRLNKWKMFKQYPFLRTDNRTIISRYGEEFIIPSIWATYRLIVDNNTDEITASNTLSDFSEQHILYATANYVGQLNSMPPPPEDEYYGFQAALHPVAGFENAHINVEPAWDEVNGNPEIKVGIIDTGLNFDHPEFGSVYNGLGGSVVEAGFDFIEPSIDPIPYDDNDGDLDVDWPHGTRMAGIIGALRNNGEGIAGIAGGDIDGGEGAGVSMSIFRAATPAGGISIGTAAEAMLFATTQGVNGTPLVDILNNSYGANIGAGNNNPEYFLTDALYPAHKAGVLVVASRGNSMDISTNNEENYPATLRENMVINVGGSGTDGQLKATEANSSISDDPNIEVTNEIWMSMFGKEMDILAPATSNLILTTNNLQPLDQLPNGNAIICDDPVSGFGNNPDYNCFNGTSSASAITSGVAALVLEKHEFEHDLDYQAILAPEDVERLIEYGATHLSPDGSYTDENGWGRLNAGASIDLISGNQKVVHFQVRTDPVLDCEFCAFRLDTKYDAPGSDYNGNGIFPKYEVDPVSQVETGVMGGTVYKYTYDVDIDFCTEYGGAQIVDPGIMIGKDPAWILNSRSNLFGKIDNDLSLQAQEKVEWLNPPVVTDCTLQGTLVGYSYADVIIDGVWAGEEIPNDGRPYQMWFSVLIDDPNNAITDATLLDNTTSVQNTSESVQNLYLFPNPTDNQLSVYLETVQELQVNHIEIYTIDGVLIERYPTGNWIQNTYQWELNTSNLPSGLYVLQVVSNAGIFQSKFIKQ